MPEMLFCYCCRVHHPKDQMRRFSTRTGSRWRCLRSIQAAAKSAGERDAFGRLQTAINQEAARRMADIAHQSPTLRLRPAEGHLALQPGKAAPLKPR